MMKDRRHAKRQSAKRVGKIVISEDGSTVDCEILNFSEIGAGLDVPRRVALPHSFTLIDVQTDRRYAARIKWRRGKRVGVEFDDLADYDD